MGVSIWYNKPIYRASKYMSLLQKSTFVPENTDNEKKFHPDGRKFIFLIDFPEILSFLL